MIRGEWKGLDAYKGKLGRIAAMSKNPRALMTEAGIYMHTEEIPRLYSLSGLHKISGDLFRSIEVRIYDFTVIIGSALKYARIHNLGGVIRAKTAPYLHFKVDGHWVKVKEVTIPKRRFLYWRREAITHIKGIWKRMLAEEWKR